MNLIPIQIYDRKDDSQMSNMHTDNHNKKNIPPLDIIDLDKNDPTDTLTTESDTKEKSKTDIRSEEESGGSFLEKYVLGINWHIVLLLVFVACIGLLIYRFSNWGTIIKSDYDPNNVNTEFEIESHDNILPLLVDDEIIPEDDGIRTIVAFGNAPFADDKGTDDDLSSMIEELSGAVVYNCSVSGSFLAATEPFVNANIDPLDAFNFYWMIALANEEGDHVYDYIFSEKSDLIPEDAKEAYELLRSIDFNTVDVIAVMYDAADYLNGRYVYNPDNLTDVQSFFGNMSAGIQLIQSMYPHIRIIVMSPTYAYAVDDNGDYVSSDLYLYSEHPLSMYSMLLEQCAAGNVVSFVDNFYGTVNELNAEEYLIDNVSLNAAGRKKVAERFVYALEYYDE